MKCVLGSRTVISALIMSQCSTAAWKELVPAFSAQGARTLVWERYECVCTLIWYTEVKPERVNVTLCGRNIHDYYTTNVFRCTHPKSLVIQSQICRHLCGWWQHAGAEDQRLEMPKVEQERPLHQSMFCLVQGLHVAVHVRMVVILHRWLLQH